MGKDELVESLRLPAFTARVLGVLHVLMVVLMGFGNASSWLMLPVALLWFPLGRGLSQGKELARKFGVAVFFYLLLTLFETLVFVFFGSKFVALLMGDVLREIDGGDSAELDSFVNGGVLQVSFIVATLFFALILIGLTLPFRRCLNPKLRGVLDERGDRLAHLNDAGVFLLMYVVLQLWSAVLGMGQLTRQPAGNFGLWLSFLAMLGCGVIAVRLLWQGQLSGMVAQWAMMAFTALFSWQSSHNPPMAVPGGDWQHALLQVGTLNSLLLLLLFSVIFFYLSKKGLLHSAPTPKLELRDEDEGED